MKAGVCTGKGKIEIVERPIPEISDNDVLIKIEYVGVCGSDLHFFAEGGIGAVKLYEPRILGHEPVGTIVKVGKDVKDLKVGDNVTLEPGKRCKVCDFCRKGIYNMCETNRVEFLGNPYTDGAFVEYMSYPQEYVFKLPQDFPKKRAVMIEPYAVALHAVEQSGAHYGQTALVTGAGCIGIMAVYALKAHGVNTVYSLDLIQSRLDAAKKAGATEVINGKEVDAYEKLMELTNGEGVDVVIETSGAVPIQSQTVKFMKKFGMITFVGFSKGDEAPFPISSLMRKEGHVSTVFRYRNQHKKAIDELIASPIPLESLISHEYPLEDLQKALDENLEHKDTIIKAVIKCN